MKALETIWRLIDWICWAVIALACLIALGLLAAEFARPAHAQAARCGPFDQVLSALAEKYAEAPRGRGAVPGGQGILLFRTEDGATWTLVGVRPDGLTCMLAAGEAWEDLPAPIPGVVR